MLSGELFPYCFTKECCLQPPPFNNSCQHPLACFAFAFKNMPKGVGRFFLESLQRPKNEITTLYTITFLPPGMFLYSHLHLLINKISSKKLSRPNLSFSVNKPYKSFSLREENTLLSRVERFLLARRIVYLREGNEEYSHRTGTNAL